MGKKTAPQPHPAIKTQVAKEEFKNGPGVCGFVSVEEVTFRCGNHSTSKSMVYVHTQTDAHSYLCI